jgi:catechol 2,3-dioxygenase-like lactoylglutathione lyase family enzyme
MQPRAVHHVSINVGDVAAATRFYVDVLGLAQRDDRPDDIGPGAWLDAGGQQVHLIQAERPTARGQHFALLVDDLDATVAELRARGVDVGGPRPIGTSRQSFLADPDGNLVELHQASAPQHRHEPATADTSAP